MKPTPTLDEEEVEFSPKPEGCIEGWLWENGIKQQVEFMYQNLHFVHQVKDKNEVTTNT